MPAILILIVFVSSCSKPTEPPPASDVVVGRYRGEYQILPPDSTRPGFITIELEVYKTAPDKYAVRKLSAADFPDFAFELDRSGGAAVAGFLTNDLFFVIPKQVSGTVSLESSSLSFSNSSRQLSFTLPKTASVIYWQFNGRKQ